MGRGYNISYCYPMSLNLWHFLKKYNEIKENLYCLYFQSYLLALIFHPPKKLFGYLLGNSQGKIFKLIIYFLQNYFKRKDNKYNNKARNPIPRLGIIIIVQIESENAIIFRISLISIINKY